MTSLLLLRLPQEIQDQIYGHTIDYGVIFRYTDSSSDTAGPNDDPQLALSIACREVVSSPLMEIHEFRVRVQKVYDLRIKTLRSRIIGSELTITPDLVDLIRTSRFELYTYAPDSIAWLHTLPLTLGSNITSIRLGEKNVRSPGRDPVLADIWRMRYSGFSDFTRSLRQLCPCLTEIGAWIPARYDFAGYATMAATELCTMLEEGRVERVCFVLFGGVLERSNEHPLLDHLLKKEALDIEEIEASYHDGSHVEAYVKSEEARIAALGPRFEVEMERQRNSIDGNLNDHTVITFHRLGEK